MGRLREEDDRDRGAAGPSMRTAGSGGRWWRRLCCRLREGRSRFWRVKVGEREEVRGCLVWAVGGCREG